MDTELLPVWSRAATVTRRIPHPLPQAAMKCLLTDRIDMDRGVRVNESLAGRTLASGLVSHAACVLVHVTVCTS